MIETPPALIPLTLARTTPNEPGRASALLAKHGSFSLRYYVPPMPDLQTPHDQDELYVVAAGAGWFRRAGERVACVTGDALFVAAGVEHRFEDCSPGFAAWVMFWGPVGGEAT
ncbi:MAG TPA: cupin domain-containing protein [Aliidongia sp.]|uniref:cupin domain-containing protein n=1 Tax=Aliidongia sp. TaxID=1914230 RepID=UPI002DDC9E46|nr:cupin domain-containing protein [Aliidongia sp.]HEV2678126.1 cupin domain-containing protein [Aliidongia sp.]